MNAHHTATAHTDDQSTAAPVRPRGRVWFTGKRPRTSAPLHEALAVGLGCNAVGRRMTRPSEWE